MAYVSVPKDLTKVKNKLVFNLTKRQLICLGAGAAIGLPFYFLTQGILGTSNAATGMVLLMLPAFLFAMYEKDGMYLEQILKNVITVRFLKPSVRKYKVENIYDSSVAKAVGDKKGGSVNEKKYKSRPHRKKTEKAIGKGGRKMAYGAGKK